MYFSEDLSPQLHHPTTAPSPVYRPTTPVYGTSPSPEYGNPPSISPVSDMPSTSQGRVSRASVDSVEEVEVLGEEGRVVVSSAREEDCMVLWQSETSDFLGIFYIRSVSAPVKMHR